MLSVIVLSSDGYSDCWEPLFMSFKKYFSGIENYELILSTNTKTYTHPGLKIKTVTHGIDTAWSKRLQNTLDQAKNDVVLVLVEDFFLRSKLNSEIFQKIIHLMLTDKVDHVRLIYYRYKIEESEFPYLDKISKKTRHRLLYAPGLWKKQVMKKYLVDFEMPYMAERMGDFRAKILDDKFYSISQEYIKENGEFYDCYDSGALYKGRWKNWVVAFLKKHNLELDLSKRGFENEEDNIKMRNKTWLGLIKSPVSTFKSLSSVVILFFKVKLKLKS